MKSKARSGVLSRWPWVLSARSAFANAKGEAESAAMDVGTVWVFVPDNPEIPFRCPIAERREPQVWECH